MASRSFNKDKIAKQIAAAEEFEKDEKRRAERIRSGTERINAMFSEAGGSYITPITGMRTEIIKEKIKNKKYDPKAKKKANKARRRFNEQLDKYGKHSGRTKGGGFEREVALGNVTPMAPERYGVPKYITKTTEKKVRKGGNKKKQRGLGKDFYGDFENAIIDYYAPEIQDQYAEAKEQNLYDLARRGMLRSSVAATNAVELSDDLKKARERVELDAENQTGALRGRMGQAQSDAISLLERTDDPTRAADAARREVNAIQSEGPTFDPLGELFSAAARSYDSYQRSQRARNAYSGVPTRNPYTSSGRNVGS